jgi:hypothetical protein
MIGGNQMSVVPNERDDAALLGVAPCEGSTNDRISKQAREETIRLRAYDLYLKRGCEQGSDVDDWLRAEIECFG